MEKYKEKIYRQLMWDYNISPEEIDKLMKGEAEFAGHYDIDNLFRKMLENLVWYDILKILTLDQIKELLTDKVIQKLRFKSIQKKYARLQKVLRGQALSSSGWDSSADEQISYPILSDRRYGIKPGIF